jgi:phospholipid-binding lipoprotein MlaA
MFDFRPVVLASMLGVSLILGGCASSNPKDPLEGFNRGVYRFNDTLDKAILKPVAQGYKAVIPSPLRKMVHNFFSNLDDVLVTANDLLQFKFAQASSDFTRVWVNSTFGVLGLFDVAHKLEKHDEDFGQTLGKWGVSSGPYLMIPLLGPSSFRDGAGLAVDSYAGVIGNIQHVPTRNSLYVTDKIDLRAELLDAEKLLELSAVDQYSFIRDAYLMRRQSLVYDGDPPREKFNDDEE